MVVIKFFLEVWNLVDFKVLLIRFIIVNVLKGSEMEDNKILWKKVIVGMFELEELDIVLL